jgi:hypothetical protein
MSGTKRKLQSKNTIGYTGVYKSGEKFLARISIGGRKGSVKYLGTYATAKEAALNFDRAVIRYKLSPSKLNFVKGSSINGKDYEEIMNPKEKRRKVASNNTTGFKGVSRNGKKFQAKITIDRKPKHLGTYDTAKAAGLAYDRAVVQHKQPTFALNFPDGLPIDDEDYEELKNPKRKSSSWNGKRNITGYTGVSKNKKWFKAQMRVRGKIEYLGTYATAKKAALAFDRAVIKSQKLLRRLNFPNMWANELAVLKGVGKEENESEKSESEESESEESESEESESEESESEDIEPIANVLGVLDVPEKYKKPNFYEMSPGAKDFIPHRVSFCKTEKRQQVRTTGIVVSKRTQGDKVIFSCYEDFARKNKLHRVDNVTFIAGHDQKTLKPKQWLWVRWMKKKNRGVAPAEKKYMGVVTRVDQGRVYVKYHMKVNECLLHKGSQFTKVTNLFSDGSSSSSTSSSSSSSSSR